MCWSAPPRGRLASRSACRRREPRLPLLDGGTSPAGRRGALPSATPRCRCGAGAPCSLSRARLWCRDATRLRVVGVAGSVLGSNERGHLGAGCDNGRRLYERRGRPVSSRAAVDVEHVVRAAGAVLTTPAVTAEATSSASSQRAGRSATASLTTARAGKVLDRLDHRGDRGGETPTARHDSPLSTAGAATAGHLSETAALISTTPARVAQCRTWGLEAVAHHTAG